MKTLTPSRIGFQLLLLSIPSVLFFVVLQSIPIDRFTSRTWEALALGSNRNAPFLRNQSLVRVERGDLALHEPDALTRTIRFETDQFGYRNITPACPDPYAVVIGDSMAVGGALSQNETPAAELNRRFGRCVRSFAGGSYSYALNSVYGLGLRPKLVFLILTERTAGGVPAFPDPNHPGYGAHTIPLIQAMHRELLQVRKNLYWNFRARHGVFVALRRAFQAPTGEAPAPKLQEGRKIRFLDGDWEKRVSDSAMDSGLEHLEKLASDLETQGAKLIYTFVPNKSSIYPGPFTPQTMDFIDRFLPKTKGRKARFIDLFHPFREDWKKGVMNHHLEDTHWNARGVQRFVAELNGFEL